MQQPIESAIESTIRNERQEGYLHLGIEYPVLPKANEKPCGCGSRPSSLAHTPGSLEGFRFRNSLFRKAL